MAFDLVTQQPDREVADGVRCLRSQAPLRIHAKGEEEDAAVLALFRVVRLLNRVGLIDDLVDILSAVGGAADTGDENVDGKRLPVVDSCDIPRPVVGG